MSDMSTTIGRADRFRDDSSKRDDDAIDLRGIIITLRKYKWPIILVTALATALTALMVSAITPQYRATATLLFDTSESQSSFQAASVNIGTLQDIQTQVEVLKSRTLAARIVDELELANHWEYNPTIPTPEEYNRVNPSTKFVSKIKGLLPSKDDASDGLQLDEGVLKDRMISKLVRRTIVAPLKNTNLVKVSVEGVDRELAARLANGIGTGYVSFYLDQTDGRNSEARAFLDEKVADLKQKYETAEQQLLSERRRVGIQGDGGDFAAQTIALITSRLVDAKTTLEDARIEWDEIRQVRNSVGGGRSGEVTLGLEGAGTGSVSNFEFVGTAYETLPVVDSNSLVQGNKQRVQEAQRVLDELSNRYGSKHPRVVDATSNLETATNNLDRQIANVISSVENRFLSNQRLVQSIQADIRREEEKSYALTAGAAAIGEIKLDRDTNKKFYEEALSELRDLQEKDRSSVPLRISDVAAIPSFPVKPKKTLIVMLGFLLSLFGISALFFAYESMKETVQGIHDVEKKLGIPVYGIVPVMRSGVFGKKTQPLVPGEFDDKRGAFEEAIRTIRTGATMTDLESRSHVIMITSSVPAEGKSTLASNLAFSMSKLENVVLVEADMRRPGLGRALGVRSRGLSDLLEGEAYLEDCMRIDAIGNLDIIPAGRVPETHLELLASPEFAELIDLLKNRYDRVIIDLAPVQAVSDAIVVGKYADTAIYVIKSDSTPLPVVRRGIDRLQEAGIAVSGAVISQVDLNKISSYGGDYYYQGYYDYYGYGEGKSKKKSIVRDETSFAARSRAREDQREAGKVRHLKRRDMEDGTEDPSVGEDFRA